MTCRAGCRTGGHATWGECARDANLQIDRYSLAYGNVAKDKAKDATLDRYRDLRAAGALPDSPLKSDVDKAEKHYAKTGSLYISNQ